MRIKNDKQRAVLNVAELADQLERIGENEMGHFSYAEAGFFHAAVATLVTWVATVEQTAFSEDELNDDDYERAAQHASRIADAREGFSD